MEILIDKIVFFLLFSISLQGLMIKLQELISGPFLHQVLEK